MLASIPASILNQNPGRAGSYEMSQPQTIML